MSTRVGRSIAARWALAALAGAALAGTGGCQRWREMREQRRLDRERARQAEDASFLDARQPGLVVELVPVRDTTPTVASVLGPYETRPVPADPAMLLRWREAGLRIVSVPEGELDAVLAPLVSAGAGEERQWAEAPNWTPIAAGPWEGAEVLDTGDAPARVGPGRTRLLARAWFEPWIVEARGAGDTGGIRTTMRLEFVPQRERPRAGRTLSAVEAPDRPGGAPDAGPVLAELALTLRATGGEAFVIAGAEPGADWSGESVDAAPAPGGEGPSVPRVATVGESMLVDPGEVVEEEDAVRVRPPARVLVVVRPRLPGEVP